ncbi:MAG: hypothetical protein MUP03_08760 [Anaerolineales bacterium]|nr:hypothetical protein [Anaerolineales bacterium]
MTLEEDVKKLVEWHTKYEKIDADNAEKNKAINRTMLLLVWAVLLILAFFIGLTVGYEWGSNVMLERVVDVVGPGIRVLV